MVIVAKLVFFLSYTCSCAVVAHLRYIPDIKFRKRLLQFPRALLPLTNSDCTVARHRKKEKKISWGNAEIRATASLVRVNSLGSSSQLIKTDRPSQMFSLSSWIKLLLYLTSEVWDPAFFSYKGSPGTLTIVNRGFPPSPSVIWLRYNLEHAKLGNQVPHQPWPWGHSDSGSGHLHWVYFHAAVSQPHCFYF